jgi:hypothetical protein
MTNPRRQSALAAAPPREPWHELLLIFLGYLLLGVVFTWPLALSMAGGVIQKGGLAVDAGQGVWNLWWARTAVLNGWSPFETRYLFYPLQLNLFLQTLSLPNALLAAPVLLAAGPVAAFNTLALLSFGLGGLFAYRIARALVDDRLAALAAGFVFAFGPYHIQRLWSGPMELIAVQWAPLYILLLMAALARRSLPSVALAAAALLVTTLASQYYGLYAAVYTAAHAGLAALLAPRGLRLRTLVAGAGVGLIWLGLLLPFVIGAGGLGGVALEDWYERQVYHSVALVDLIVPNIQHPLWGAAAAKWHGRLHPFGLEAGAGVGLVVYALCGLALLRGWRRAWPWLLLGLLCLLLAMGPQLRLTAAPSPLPGPFLLLDLAGPFRNSSRPSVFVALALVPVSALVALGLAGLRSWGRGEKIVSLAAVRGVRGRSTLAGALVALLVAEALVAPWPITELRAAPYVYAMNADQAPGAVLALPARNNDSRGLLDQICHGRPQLGGYLARLPDYPLARYPSAVQRLLDAQAPGPDILDLSPAAQLATLGVRFVALDLTELPRFRAGRIREQLAAEGVELVRADEVSELYAVDPDAAKPTAVLGSGWYDVESDGARVWRWAQGRAELTLLMPAAGPAALSFVATAYGQPRELQIRLGDGLMRRVEVPAAPYDSRVSLALMLPPGPTTLTLESPAVASPDGRQLSLSVSDLRVASLPTAAGYAASPAPAPPPTIPLMEAPPCR